MHLCILTIFSLYLPLVSCAWGTEGFYKLGQKYKSRRANTGTDYGDRGLYSTCKSVKTRDVEGYFKLLETGRSDLREKNDYVYKDITFPTSVLISGWTVHGKNGTIKGPFVARRGIITEYKVRFLDQFGSWKSVKNGSREKNKVFINDGNLAKPYVNTTVKLKIPVKTKILRLFPQLWDGVPYIYMRFEYCEVQHKPRRFKGNLKPIENIAWNKKQSRIRVDKLKKIAANLTRNQNDIDESPRHKTHRKSQSKSKFSSNWINGKKFISSINFNENKKIIEKEGDEHKNIDGSLDILARRLHHKLNSMTAGLLSQTINEQDLQCRKRARWRYTGKSPPFDEFTTFGNSHQAWRAIYDLDVQPYQFPVTRRGNNKLGSKNYLQITFQDPVKIYGIKTIGGNDERRWGIISKFALLYRMGNRAWRYYSDDTGKLRSFDIGEKKLSDAFTPSVFRLPIPIKATSIRIYPKSWNGKPLLSIDFKTCDLVRKSRGKSCSIPILKNNNNGHLSKFFGLKKRQWYQNKFKYQTILLSERKPVIVTAIRVIPPSSDTEDGKLALVTDFILQYQSVQGKMKNIVDGDSIVKIFSVKRGELGNLKPVTVKLWKPVHTRLLRLFPESWSGKNPVVYLNVLGCPE